MPESAPRIMFYHDGRHPLIYMYEPPIEKEEYEAAVNELAGTPVEALMFCMGDGRTVLHETEVGELWGHNVDVWSHMIFRRAHQNAKKLIDEGNDPLQIILKKAHATGMLFYPVLLVQQGRGKREDDTRCSEFRYDNQHLEIGARGDLEPDYPGFTCLDFTHEEVREERFALIDETLRKYDVDGFELQLNYFPHYFHPDETEAGCAIMTAWVRRVYEAVKESGANRELVIRVPASVEGCLEVGMDVKAWIQAGIVDVLVGQTFSHPELVDTTADFRSLVEAAADSADCRVLATIHSHMDSDRLAEAPIEVVRACATNYWAQGVDGLYVGHWFSNWPYTASFYEKLRELPHPHVMAAKDKHYYVPTGTKRHPVPVTEPGLEILLPMDLQVGEAAEINLTVSDDLRRWERVGRVHEVILRFRVMGISEIDRLQFSFNGRELPKTSMRRINQLYRMTAPRYRTESGYWFIFRLDSENLPEQGTNRVGVLLLEKDPHIPPRVFLRDVELEIKYLMGKGFHRELVDADLGSYEGVNE